MNNLKIPKKNLLIFNLNSVLEHFALRLSSVKLEKDKSPHES